MSSEKKNQLNEVLDGALGNLKQLIDVNTIIGDAITVDDKTTIIPISKVSFGFAAGGSDLPTTKPNTPFGGGSGGGVTIEPIGFIVCCDGKVSLLQLQTAFNTADRVVNMVPDVVDKFASFINDKGNKKEEANS